MSVSELEASVDRLRSAMFLITWRLDRHGECFGRRLTEAPKWKSDLRLHDYHFLVLNIYTIDIELPWLIKIAVLAAEAPVHVSGYQIARLPSWTRVS